MVLRLTEEQYLGLSKNKKPLSPKLRCLVPQSAESSLYEILAYGSLYLPNSPCTKALKVGLQDIANPSVKYKPFESVEQAASLVWLEYSIPYAFEMASAIPMGGYRPNGSGGKIKGEGAKLGYPDLLVDIARMGYHGLRIEMKQNSKNTKPTEEQNIRLLRLAKHGYRSVLCRGHQSAIKIYCEYFDHPVPNFVLPDWAIIDYNK